METLNLRNAQFRILGGARYSRSDRPKDWHAACSLQGPGAVFFGPPHIDNLPLLEFPEIEDFSVVLEEMIDGAMNYHVKFFSKTRGFLAGFPWWDHAEHQLAMDNFCIPLGVGADPFYAWEQDWEIVIFRHEGFVYVLEGDFELVSSYHAWFKVSESRYLNQWNEAITICSDLAPGSQTMKKAC